MVIGIGMTLGMLSGPLFPDWRAAFTYIGIVTLVVAFSWVFLAKSAPKGVEIKMPPMISGIKRGLRNRNILLTCAVYFLFMGTIMSFTGNFPEALEIIHKVSPATAGATTSLLTVGGVLGNLIIPTISDRIGLRKPFIYTSAIATPLCLFFAWYLAPSPATWVLVALGGIGVGGLPPIILTLPLELPEIGRGHVGGATGLIISTMALGGFAIPLWVMSPIVSAGTAQAYTTGFVVVLLLFAAMIVPTLFLMETGGKVRTKR